MASDFGGEDRIENEESESDYQSGLKQYNRPQRWSIFQGDGMVNVFFRTPLPSMVFQWF